MNMFKKNGGFTLVELIVVIAILAILAGIAIPAYSGYITKAQDAAVVTELDAIATAAQAANATEGEITGIEVTSDGIVVEGESATNYAKDFVLFYQNAQAAAAGSTVEFTFKTAIGLEDPSYEDGATWANGKWTAGVN